MRILEECKLTGAVNTNLQTPFFSSVKLFIDDLAVEDPRKKSLIHRYPSKHLVVTTLFLASSGLSPKSQITLGWSKLQGYEHDLLNRQRIYTRRHEYLMHPYPQKTRLAIRFSWHRAFDVHLLRQYPTPLGMNQQ